MAVETTRWAVIYCPKGGILDTSNRRWARVEQALKHHDIAYDKVQSESQGSVERIVKMMINNGYKTLLIVGGDSALNDAVNCLMHTEKHVREEIALGVIPNGVMNDFATFWGISDGDVDQTVASLKKRRLRRIDLGCIRYQNKSGVACHRYFLNCVNVGYIAAIMNLRRRTRHILGSRTLSLIFSFVLLLFQRADYSMRLQLNSDILKRRIMSVCVGNARGYGQTPNAVPYNGLLDVSIVGHTGLQQLLQGFYLLLRGHLLNHRSVSARRTREIIFERTDGAPVSVDGRLISGAPRGAFTITVEQEVLNFIIPA